MSSKNLAVMMSAMMIVRSIDQEDPHVLLVARIGFGVYVLVSVAVYLALHIRILAQNDRSKIRVPIPTPPFGPGSNAPPGERETTHLEYDLEMLRTARQGWIFNTLLLTAFHYKMQNVSPLIMSGIMGFVRLVTDDALVKLHLYGYPSVDKLKRPFPTEENPLTALLKGMVPNPEDMNRSSQGEDLHDDGDSEDGDNNPLPSVADLSDDHVEGDFEDDESENKKSK